MLWIGYYTFLEAVRNRLLLGILVLIIPVFTVAWLLDVYNLDLQVKFIKDIALNVISGFGLLVVVVLSLDQIIPDLERKTVYFIFSRSPSRYSYLFGRFLGIVLSLAFSHIIMTGAVVTFLRLYFKHWFLELPVGIFIIFLKQIVLIALILLLCTFSSKIVVLSLSALIYVLGHFFDVFRMWATQKRDSLLAIGIEIVAFLFPDFSLYEPRISVVHNIPMSPGPVIVLTLYSIAICLFYLTIGGKILEQRDL